MGLSANVEEDGEPIWLVVELTEGGQTHTELNDSAPKSWWLAGDKGVEVQEWKELPVADCWELFLLLYRDGFPAAVSDSTLCTSLAESIACEDIPLWQLRAAVQSGQRRCSGGQDK